MSDDFENKLRRMVNEDVDARLGARRAAPDRAHRVSEGGHRNWMFPLVAAAAVVAVALGTFGAVQLLADDGHTAPPASKAPSSTPTSPTSVRTLASGRTVRLGQASITLPAGWVAHDESEYVSSDFSPPGSQWCLTPANQAVHPGPPEDCLLLFSELPTALFAHGVGNGRPMLDVDAQGGFYGDPPQRCVPNVEVPEHQAFGDRTLGGRPADWRRWESHCSKTNRPIDIEQYVVATGPAYILYSTHADATVHAAMTEIATSSTLPAQTSAVRYMDRGYVRSATPTAHGGKIVIDRVVRIHATVTNEDPTTYTYRVAASVWQMAQHQHLLKTGGLIDLWTDGSKVRMIYPD